MSQLQRLVNSVVVSDCHPGWIISQQKNTCEDLKPPPSQGHEEHQAMKPKKIS